MPKYLIGVIVSLGLVILAVGAAIVYGMYLLEPVNPMANANETVRFTIPKGQAISKIGDRLVEEKLIHQSQIFTLYVKQKNLTDKIQAGSFQLSPKMSLQEIAKELTTGTDDVWVTFIEGSRAEEMTDKLVAADLPEFDQAEFLKLAQENQGYLFPDTYLIPKMSTAQSIYNLLNSTFEKKVTKGLATEIAASGRTLPDIVNMASIVQREAKDPAQKRVVAGILWNRVDLGTSLNVDVTLRFLKGYDSVAKSWWSAPLAEYKLLDSPYNTYKYPGLPPAPIGNPGLDALEAAIEPTGSDYLYYLHTSDGNIYYAKTLPEHNANVQKYLK